MCQDAMEEVEYYVLLGNTWIEMFCKCSFKSDIAKKVIYILHLNHLADTHVQHQTSVM